MAVEEKRVQFYIQIALYELAQTTADFLKIDSLLLPLLSLSLWETDDGRGFWGRQREAAVSKAAVVGWKLYRWSKKASLTCSPPSSLLKIVAFLSARDPWGLLVSSKRLCFDHSSFATNPQLFSLRVVEGEEPPSLSVLLFARCLVETATETKSRSSLVSSSSSSSTTTTAIDAPQPGGLLKLPRKQFHSSASTWRDRLRPAAQNQRSAGDQTDDKENDENMVVEKKKPPGGGASSQKPPPLIPPAKSTPDKKKPGALPTQDKSKPAPKGGAAGAAAGADAAPAAAPAATPNPDGQQQPKKKKIVIPFVLPWESRPALQTQHGMGAFGTKKEVFRPVGGKELPTNTSLKSENVLTLFNRSNQFSSQAGMHAFGSHRDNVTHLESGGKLVFEEEKLRRCQGVIPRQSGTNDTHGQAGHTPMGAIRRQVMKIEYRPDMREKMEKKSEGILTKLGTPNTNCHAGTGVMDKFRRQVPDIAIGAKMKKGHDRRTESVLPKFAQKKGLPTPARVSGAGSSGLGLFRQVVTPVEGGYALTSEDIVNSKKVVPWITTGIMQSQQGTGGFQGRRDVVSHTQNRLY